jgi:predicted DsbA family dithiol-disulfide isomerase
VPEIEVFADICCPFAHVGLRRLSERRAASGRTDVHLRVRAWPLELVNGAPLDPAFIAEEVDALRAQVAPDLFVGFDPARFPPSSMPALALAAAAYERGPEVGERMSFALRDALFEAGRDVADPAVLAELAASVGVDGPGAAARERVVDDWREGRSRGVIGSPHFFVGAANWFCPTLAVTRVEGHLRICEDHDRLGPFLDLCFA